MSASWSWVRTSSRPSASVATIGFPIASASNTVSGVPSHSDGNTLRSNAETTRGDVAREAGEDEAIAEAERARLRFERRAQRPFADQEEPRLRPRVEHRARRVDQVRVALRVVQARDRADGEVAGRDRPARARAARNLARRCAARLNSSSGTPR